MLIDWWVAYKYALASDSGVGFKLFGLDKI